MAILGMTLFLPLVLGLLSFHRLGGLLPLRAGVDLANRESQLTPKGVRALEHQRVTRKRLGESLIDIGAVTSVQLSQALADHLGVPFVDLELHPPDVLLAGMIPEEVARRYCALPVERWNGQIVVAMANPNDVFALDDIRVLTGQSILAALADSGHIIAAIERAYSGSELIESSLLRRLPDFASS